MDATTKEVHTIRPAGKHILTIGSELIQDKAAAIIELVKNAYDADSGEVKIKFEYSKSTNNCKIVIGDKGHGMSRSTVLDKWMVPSTPDKVFRRTSPKGRILQGRKGIGRYATSILGTNLLLETIDQEGEKTTVFVEWNLFEKAKYLSDVEILVESEKVNFPPGTTMTIDSSFDQLRDWVESDFKQLRFELRKMISPIDFTDSSHKVEDPFFIYLEIINNDQELTTALPELIEPFPIIDLFDYKISGTVEASGKGTFQYKNNKVVNTVDEAVFLDLDSVTFCGKLHFDIRVYDRDREAIVGLISRGLTHENGTPFERDEALELLNVYNGIGVYRNGFRIRPLGDPQFDWLVLNKRRVQNPSQRIGSDQAIGYVLIESEENSHLVEKSARDGLKENQAYESLISITQKVISLLESRRFLYRQKAGLSRPVLKVERTLERLFDYEKLEGHIRKALDRGSVNKEVAERVIKLLEEESEEKNKLVDEIRQTVAIYQGQATLGKIINVVLHEGRRPLNYFKNQIPNFDYWCKSFLDTRQGASLKRLLPIVEGIGKQSELFVTLFSKLDPLASGKRPRRRRELIKGILEQAGGTFESSLVDNGIGLIIQAPDDVDFECWKQDLHIIITNLIDNSLYWLTNTKCDEKLIRIEAFGINGHLKQIDYYDSGPGINEEHISSGILFEPHFTTKPNGTGLGLAIAGEAAQRNALQLKAIASTRGAHFRLQPIVE